MLRFSSASRAFLFILTTTTVTQSGCNARSAHDEVFFSCSAQAPQCPANQECNLQDNCCHLIDEPEGTPLGHCKLGPGGTGFPGSGATASSQDAEPISTQ